MHLLNDYQPTVLVHKGQALEDLKGHVADLVLRYGPGSALHQLVHVGLHVLENHKQLVVFPHHLLELDNIGVV